MSDQTDHRTGGPPTTPGQEESSWLKIFAIVIVACVISTLVALGAVYYFLFHGSIEPVELSAREEQALEQKIDLGLNGLFVVSNNGMV